MSPHARMRTRCVRFDHPSTCHASPSLCPCPFFMPSQKGQACQQFKPPSLSLCLLSTPVPPVEPEGFHERGSLSLSARTLPVTFPPSAVKESPVPVSNLERPPLLIAADIIYCPLLHPPLLLSRHYHHHSPPFCHEPSPLSCSFSS